VFVALVLTASACAKDPSGSASSIAAGVLGRDSPPKWVGEYESSGRACSSNPLAVHESKFTWGDCKEVTIRVIASSNGGLVFEADPKAKCAWEGWIIALSQDWEIVDVHAYRNLKDYQAKQYGLFCSYTKKTE
jgi:hypothetical protein